VSAIAATAPLRARIAQLRAFVWRFHTLPLAARMFADTGRPLILRRTFFGYPLHVEVSRSNLQRLLFLDGERYISERKLVRGLLAPGMRVADVGANIGYYLLLIESVVGAAGSVVCVEPEAANLRELRRNIAANGFTNVKVVAAAAGAEDGAVSLRSGINAAIVGAGAGDQEVQLVRLDSALAGPVDFLKIDVEGYEGQVLAGAQRVLAEHRPTLFLEVHPGMLAPPYTVGGILDLITGYYPAPQLFEIAPQTGLAAKLAVRYLGRQVRRLTDAAGLLAECQAGRRTEPFWMVCRGAHEST
jgi:FkbM family methyltransferase